MRVIEEQIVSKAYVPEVITKELALQNKGNGRNIVLSTNFLPLMGFEEGVRHNVIPLNNAFEGLMLSCDVAGKQKVYQRKYNSRRNNPFETQIHIQNQSIINAGIPAYTERVHFEMSHGQIIIRPLANQTFNIRKRMFDSKESLNAFVAMTGGIDVRCLMDCGFKIDSVLEYRVPEKRDKTDLSETGMLSVLANAAPRNVFNEDISKIDMRMVARIMENSPVIANLHISLQCDEFSALKSKRMREESLEDLSTSADLVYDALRLVETVRPATITLEQVEGFADSGEGRLFTTKLRRWGYHVSQKIADAKNYHGMTGRKRYYVVASIWPNFAFPESFATERKEKLWETVQAHFSECRNVSHTNSVKEGIKTGRIRIINKESVFAPTLTKSQDRQAKDSVYIEHEGDYYFPSLELLRKLNGIPQDFDFNSVGRSIQSELIGQSIEVPMHEAIMVAVREHIYTNIGHFSMININKGVDKDGKKRKG